MTKATKIAAGLGIGAILGAVAFMALLQPAKISSKECKRAGSAAVRFEWAFRRRAPSCEPEQLAAPIIPWKIR